MGLGHVSSLLEFSRLELRSPLGRGACLRGRAPACSKGAPNGEHQKRASGQSNRSPVCASERHPETIPGAHSLPRAHERHCSRSAQESHTSCRGAPGDPSALHPSKEARAATMPKAEAAAEGLLEWAAWL